MVHFVPAIYTLKQQINAMKRHWPDFDVSELAANNVVWFGALAGIERKYRLMVEYRLPPLNDAEVRARSFPIVRVLSPRLRPQYRAKDGPLPHVYFDSDDITLSPLCLFDPREGEWCHDLLIALTTISWAADWLACYEGWRATGEWTGGGRHQFISAQEATQ